MAATDAASSRNFTFKVVLLGEGCVGKTSLVLRYVENKFNDKHISTLQKNHYYPLHFVEYFPNQPLTWDMPNFPPLRTCMCPKASYLDKKLNINGKRVNLAIWDTAGQEKFHALGPIYYRESNGAVLVYDITDESSFQKVKNWVKELRTILGTDVCLCIAGNKTDLEKQRTVPLTDAELYATSVGARHFHTSAKINKGIEEMFLDLTQRMIDVAQTNTQNKPTSLGRSSSRRNMLIIDDESPPVQKSGCCG